jgi:hypothetical protein
MREDRGNVSRRDVLGLAALAAGAAWASAPARRAGCTPTWSKPGGSRVWDAGGKGGKPAFGFPGFPQPWHFHSSRSLPSLAAAGGYPQQRSARVG